MKGVLEGVVKIIRSCIVISSGLILFIPNKYLCSLISVGQRVSVDPILDDRDG